MNDSSKKDSGTVADVAVPPILVTPSRPHFDLLSKATYTANCMLMISMQKVKEL